MIDTDSGRGLKYADRPDVYPDLNPYLYLRLDPPHSSERYQEAIKAANSQGAGCIVVDTGSDEWDGDGGVLDQFQKRVGNDEKKNMAGMGPRQAPSQALCPLAHPAGLSHNSLLPRRAQDRSGQRRKADIHGDPAGLGNRYSLQAGFHLHMKDKDKPGVYEPWFRGLQHERGIFPGGTVDAATVKRLLASYAGESAVTGPAVAPGAAAAAVSTPPAPVNGEGFWELTKLGGELLYVYPGDASTREAQKGLFRLLRTRFSMKDMTPEEKETALQIAEDNQHLIDGLPEVGKKQLNNLLQVIVQSQMGEKR